MNRGEAAREQGLHPDQEHDRRIEASEAETGLQIGAEQQRAQQIDPTEFITEEFTETVTEFDLGREELTADHPKAHNVEGKLGAHSSNQHALGKITRSEYERRRRWTRRAATWCR